MQHAGSIMTDDAQEVDGGNESVATAADWDRQSMYSPLSRVIRRVPVTCSPDLSVREVLERINSHKIGAMVIAEPQTQRPVGIFTLRDLLQRVSLSGYDLGRPVKEVMTSKLVSLAPNVSAYEAAMTMVRHGVRHLLVVDGERLVGVVSQNDLFSLQRIGVREVGSDIRDAQSIEALAQSGREIRLLAGRMMRQGMSVETLTQLVSTLNDLLTMRVIELVLPGFDLPRVPMCWIAMGSEGRFEQTLSTDQDNGIIFESPEEGRTDELRRALLPFAQAVNQALDACGFPLCKGNIMASNPEWCLSYDEWIRKFSSWILQPLPEALLNATIFFDFRPLYGTESLAERLRTWLGNTIPSHTLFLRYMAGNALTCCPPLGKIREFVVDNTDKDFPRTINLKMYGSRPFVDAARVFALAHGVPQTNTAQRLRMVGEQIKLRRDDLNAVVEGFYFIYRLRLRRQMNPHLPTAGANRVNPYSLNDMDRQMLKESFKQARKLQLRLTLEYGF